MASALSTRLKYALRLLFPVPSELAYLARIRRSGLFDRQFYLSTNMHLHPLYRLFPERHYIQWGERAGFRPNPEFSPAAYLRHNPDLTEQVSRPLLHYIQAGRHEARITKDLPPVDAYVDVPLAPLRAGTRRARFAVVAHVFYHDLWDEMAQAIARQSVGMDVIVTVVRFQQERGDIEDRILADFPQARVVPVPNHGRDIFPFVHVVNSGLLAGYEAVCKIHTKKSPHRRDGDVWRGALIGGVLGPAEATAARLETFLAREDAMFWVADGQCYRGAEWWGSNRRPLEALLARIGIRVGEDLVPFPAGSMYWMKPLAIDMIRGLRLTHGDFQRELAQVDGTLAHAMERALGFIAAAGGKSILQAGELDQPPAAARRPRPSFTSAFYLPQFHPVPENDEWWGKGFTEWRGVVNAAPQFPGHAQPCLPADLGYYDLRVPETMADQAALARQAGIDAFCVYHYWFDGRRILERPVDMLLDRPEIDFPFYLCWANESWRRNWDGLSGEVLLEQPYSDGFAEALARDLLPYLRDPRYARPDGERPRFVIYRPEDMPDAAGAVGRMRETWSAAGVGAVEIGAVRFHVEGAHPVAEDVFDFWVEMPPHGLVREEDYLVGGRNAPVIDTRPGFEGLVYDYPAVARRATGDEAVRTLPQRTIAGIMPGWDNTARRGPRAHIAHGANPASFEAWLYDLRARRLPHSYRGELFLNAWNEWAERAVLEPDQQYGDAVLRVLARHLATG